MGMSERYIDRLGVQLRELDVEVVAKQNTGMEGCLDWVGKFMLVRTYDEQPGECRMSNL